MPEGLSMEDKLRPALATDGAIHVFDPDTGFAYCGADLEQAAGPLPVDPRVCEECVTRTLIGLIIRQEGGE